MRSKGASKFRQRFVALDARDDARDAEQFREVVEHGRLVEIEAEDVVAESFAEVEEVAGAGADIEDAAARERNRDRDRGGGGC